MSEQRGDGEDAAAFTGDGDARDDAGDAGARDALPRTVAVLDEGMRDGLHVGYQLSVSLRGERVIDVAAGRCNPGHGMSLDSIMPWMSASKPVTAIAIAQLWEQGRLTLDAPAANFIDGFEQGGKGGITIRHLLTHTSGIAQVDINWPHADWTTIIDTIRAAAVPDDFVPGRDATYHPSTSWFVLAEIVQRLTHTPIARYARDHIFEPLGMESCYLSMEREQAERLSDRLGRMYLTRRGMSEPVPESMPFVERADRCAPGATGRGPMRELCRLYEMLVAGGAGGAGGTGGAMLRPQTVEAMTARHRVGLYDTGFMRHMDWGLGFVADAKQYQERKPQPYGFGPHCSPRAFGHGGHQSSNAFADPAHGLAVAWVCNGMPGPSKHDQRNHAINAAIYEDLGLDTRK